MDLWSNSMDWCGLRSIHFCWLDTTWEQHFRPLTKLPRAATATIVNLNSEDVESAKYKNKAASDVTTEAHECCKVICVCWMVRRRCVTYWSSTSSLFGAFQAASVKWLSLSLSPFYIICRTACWSIIRIRVNVSVNWVCAWRECTRDTLVRAQCCPISGCRDNCKVADSAIGIA